VIRALSGLRLADGARLLLAAVAAGPALGRRRSPGRRAVAGLLGARQIAQAALTAARGDARACELGAIVDAAHCLSMVALAAFSASARPFARRQGAVAAGWALAGAGVAAVGRGRARGRTGRPADGSRSA
jgi:hypothetical protein